MPRPNRRRVEAEEGLLLVAGKYTDGRARQVLGHELQRRTLPVIPALIEPSISTLLAKPEPYATAHGDPPGGTVRPLPTHGLGIRLGTREAINVREPKMTVLMTADLPVSRADIEAVSADIGAADNPPDGLIVHIATETAGGVHIVDIWESQEHYDKFNAERLGPAVGRRMAAMGMPMDGPPPPSTITEAFDLVRGR
jgi:hypothetical protein